MKDKVTNNIYSTRRGKRLFKEITNCGKRLIAEGSITAENVRRALEWIPLITPKERPEEFLPWTEEQWRSRHRKSQLKWNGFIKEVLPKKMQPMDPSLIQCPRCKEHKTELNLIQTRSSDEPMTEKCHCLACGYRWCNN